MNELQTLRDFLDFMENKEQRLKQQVQRVHNLEKMLETERAILNTLLVSEKKVTDQRLTDVMGPNEADSAYMEAQRILAQQESGRQLALDQSVEVEKLSRGGEPGFLKFEEPSFRPPGEEYQAKPRGDGRVNKPMTVADLASALRAMPIEELTRQTTTSLAHRFVVSEELMVEAMIKAFSATDPIEQLANLIRQHPNAESHSAFFYANHFGVAVDQAQQAYRRVFPSAS